MKNYYKGWNAGLLLALLAMMCIYAVAAVAQTNTPPVGGELPTDRGGYWDLAIAGISPMIVTLVWKVVPRIPTWVLPTITPFVGIGLGFALNKLAGANLEWFDMAKAGALAVFVREVVNKAITKRISGEAEEGKAA